MTRPPGNSTSHTGPPSIGRSQPEQSCPFPVTTRARRGAAPGMVFDRSLARMVSSGVGMPGGLQMARPCEASHPPGPQADCSRGQGAARPLYRLLGAGVGVYGQEGLSWAKPTTVLALKVSHSRTPCRSAAAAKAAGRLHRLVSGPHDSIATHRHRNWVRQGDLGWVPA
jgi:hypothetical protein